MFNACYFLKRILWGEEGFVGGGDFLWGGIFFFWEMFFKS